MAAYLIVSASDWRDWELNGMRGGYGLLEGQEERHSSVAGLLRPIGYSYVLLYLTKALSKKATHVE